MNFQHERIINCPSSPNDGKTVWVDFDLRGWNPDTDTWDEDWIPVLVGADRNNGVIGNIERKYLAQPPCINLESESA